MSVPAVLNGSKNNVTFFSFSLIWISACDAQVPVNTGRRYKGLVSPDPIDEVYTLGAFKHKGILAAV